MNRRHFLGLASKTALIGGAVALTGVNKGHETEVNTPKTSVKSTAKAGTGKSLAKAGKAPGNGKSLAKAEKAKAISTETSVVYDWLYKVLIVEKDNPKVITPAEWANVAELEDLSTKQTVSGAIVVSHWNNQTVPTETDVIFTGSNQDGEWDPLAINAIRESEDQVITPYDLAIRSGVDPTLFLAMNDMPVNDIFKGLTNDQSVYFRFQLPEGF